MESVGVDIVEVMHSKVTCSVDKELKDNIFILFRK